MAEQIYSEPVTPSKQPRSNLLACTWQDLRYALRVLRLNPAFTAICIISLALGIGANTAIFQLIDAVQMRALPVKDPQQLAIVQMLPDTRSGSIHGAHHDLSMPLWEQLQQRQQGFSSVAAWSTYDFNLANGGQAHLARGLWVSGDFFRTLGVNALLGRVITSADDVKGCGTPGAVVSYGFWQSTLGGSANAIGEKISLDGHPFDVIGVTPANFYGIEIGRGFDVAIPLCSEPTIKADLSLYERRDGWWLGAFGRLKPGWTLERASAQLNAISPASLEATLPQAYDTERLKTYRKYQMSAISGAHGFSNLRAQYNTPLSLLLAIAGLVLLIACANLANLMLARATAREREIAVRLALGAERGRLVRQLLSESLLLAAAGAAFGALLATNLSAFMVRFLSTSDNQVFLDSGTDWRVLGFTAALAALTCLLFGLAPALKATKASPASILSAAGRGMTAGRERFGLRRTLVVAQVALSLVLLVGALLFTRTLRNILTLDAGFQRTGVLVIDVDFTKLQLPYARRVPLRENLLTTVRALPGVESATEAGVEPISHGGWNNMVLVSGKRYDKDVDMDHISDQYFRTMGTPLLLGRDFDARDTAQSPRVAIVNQTFATKVLGTNNPIGRTFVIDVSQGKPRYEYQIVGMSRDSKYFDLREEQPATAYYPQAQDEDPDPSIEIMARSNLDLATLITEARAALGRTAPDVDLDFNSLSQHIEEGLVRERLLATLSGFFGLLAAILATVGLYGVVSYMVVRRTNEIGIRMALGAQPSAILRMIVMEATKLLAIGVAIGIALSLATAQAAESLLFGLKPDDPVTLVASALGLAIVTVAASLLPARRASKLEPMIALRTE